MAAPGPLLSTPLLADTAAETVDARTVKYLLQAVLMKEEEDKSSFLRPLVPDNHLFDALSCLKSTSARSVWEVAPGLFPHS